MGNPYAIGQLARALSTATSHEDAATRQRADARIRAWLSVIEGMASGQISVGSRRPARGMPVWVTLEVVRGGFATGRAIAGGPLADDELERVARMGLPRSREALFASYLTDAGLDELGALLDSRRYTVHIPEDAALLVVAALVRTGHRAQALDLLETLRPFARSLRFMPHSGRPSMEPADHLHRRTAAEVAESLQKIAPDPRVEAQREALAVWLPVTDRVVDFWLRRAAADAGSEWTPADTGEARALLTAYDRAVREHPRCRKYRNPKENLPILVAALRAPLDGELDARTLGRVRHVLHCITTKRGTPTDEATRSLRAVQAQVATQPSHAQLADVATLRMGHLRPDEGIMDPSAILEPADVVEAAGGGAHMPRVVRRKVKLGLAAPIEQLVNEAVVPSAEVLAELVPALTAQQVGASFDDPTLGALMGVTYAAFRRRRSLLLANLEKQVQFTELPWVQVAMAARAEHGRPDEPAQVARRVAALAIDSFPGTILPNPLVSELSTLYAAAGIDIPLTEELAADIFMGRFSPKYLAAAKVAAGLLRGTLYGRYYGLDFQEVLQLPQPPPRKKGLRGWLEGRTTDHARASFDALCTRDAPEGSRWSVARNGVIIERQQVLTTHNLAALVRVGDVRPSQSWDVPALEAATRALELLDLAQRQDRPLATVKDAAYAWRQAVFFTSMIGEEAQREIVERMRSLPKANQWPMSEVIDGLWQCAVNGATGPSIRPFLGWTVGRHWALRSRDGERN